MRRKWAVMGGPWGVAPLVRLAAALVLVCLVASGEFFGPEPAQAGDPNKVGLVVTHDGQVITQCIEFSDDTITGLDVLDKSGLALNYEANPSMGAGVCKLDGVGCKYPKEVCFCECVGSPCVYWSYWHLENGKWSYASKGASSYKVEHGDVEGWNWGEGTLVDAEKPPVFSFEELCDPAPEPERTSTPEPTNEIVEDDEDLPVIEFFDAERDTIALGESVVLSWDLHDAEEAYLRVNGQEQGVVAPGTTAVSPVETTTYVLVARNNDGEVTEEITVKVDLTAVADVVVPTDTPAATAPPPTDMPVPVEEAAPTAATPAPVEGSPTAEGEAADSAVESASSPEAEEVAVVPTVTPTDLPELDWTDLGTAEAGQEPAAAGDETAAPNEGTGEPATPVTLADTALDESAQSTRVAEQLERANQESGSTLPVAVLAVIGAIAVVGGLVSLLLIGTASRRKSK